LKIVAARADGFSTSALIIDYGYGRTDYGDSFQAVAQHAYADPLANPGAQDLTAHVNFGLIADFARAGALHAAGPTAQGNFLVQMGIRQRAERLLAEAETTRERLDVTLGAHRLTAADEMGTLFKVICLSSPTLLPPEGFHAS
ncbi:MAG TPA: methyltransferase, partial [Rhodospirillaceae bacterium]|nr:methyltransferase [Rhodospirillaceae bacterium]